MTGPLSGFRVVDFTTGTAGPRATGFLRDYGAEVIWIEPPGGDRFREELSVQYSVFNRGKRSLILDLTDPRELAVMYDLIASADVFVESRRPGVADRLGLGYEEVHRRAPHLVYCSISGFGSEGQHSQVPGYESLVHALVGTMGEQPGHRDHPIYEAVPFASIGASYLADIGVVGALWRRAINGQGRRVETSLLDGALAYLSMLWSDADVPLPPRDPGARRLIARNFQCSDGAIIGVHTGAVGAFGRLMQVLQLDDVIPPSQDGLDMGVYLTPEQRSLLDSELPTRFAARTRAEWMDVLLAADICTIPLLEPLDVFDQAQVRHNEMVVEVDDPALGRVEQVGPPARFDGFDADLASAAPLAGADNGIVDELVSRSPFGVGSGDLVDKPLLDGVRVLDLGAFFAGPYASRLLADLGADVVRVETLKGDPNRGTEAIFRTSHAGMRSLAVDLKAPDGLEIVKEQIAAADVVHHSMRPGAAERLGVSREDVRSYNPNAIYAYAPGWGSSGPQSSWQSFAPLMSGYVGAAFEAAGQFNPPVYPAGNEDPGNGLLGAFVMLAGVLRRELTGQAVYVEHPQLNASLIHVSHTVRSKDGAVLGAMRLDPLQYGFSALDRLYETADGWVCLVATSDAEIHALSKALEIDVLTDDRFATYSDRQTNDYALSSLIGGAIAARDTADVIERFRSSGVPSAVPLPHNMKQFLQDQRNMDSGRVAEMPHAARGRVREIARLIRVSDVEPAPHQLAPQLGEHSAELLREAGRRDEEISELLHRGVIAGPTA